MGREIWHCFPPGLIYLFSLDFYLYVLHRASKNYFTLNILSAQPNEMQECFKLENKHLYTEILEIECFFLSELGQEIAYSL